MNTFKTILRHEWLLLTRNRVQLIILAVFIAAALYAVYYGNAEISKQEQTIHAISRQNAKEQASLAKGLDADTSTAAGMAAYEAAAYPSKVRFYLNFYAINEPTAFSKLSIGQRDIYPYYLQLNAQNLYLQLFKSEISNPGKLLAGNFDLAFVIIYLLPLLIVAFTFNLLPSEKELGTLALLKIQPVSMRTILIYKLSFYFIVVVSLVVAVSIIGFFGCGVSIGEYRQISLWLTAALLYITCWFLLILLINSFDRDSAFNAMWSLGLWLLTLMIIPSVLNLTIIGGKKVDATQLTNAIRRQQGMSETEEDMRALVARFYRAFPNYKSGDTTKHDFLQFKAYSAFVTFRDMAARSKVDEYYQSIWDRNRLISRFDIINPAVNTQNIFNAISKAGLENSFDFRNSIIAFHQQLSHFSHAPLFADRLMTKEDFRSIPVFSMNEHNDNNRVILTGFAWLALLSVALLAAGNYKLLKI